MLRQSSSHKGKLKEVSHNIYEYILSPSDLLNKRQKKRKRKMAVWEPNKLPIQDEGNGQIQGSINDKEPVTDLTDDNAPKNPMIIKSIEEIDFDDDTNAPDFIKNIPDKAMRRLKYEEYYLTLKEKKLQARLEQALMMKNKTNSQTQKASDEQTAVAQTQESNMEEQKKENETNEDAERKVLEGLPSEIKLVVQEKFKTLATIKKPIIMPSVVEESAVTASVIQSAPVKYDHTQKSPSTASSVLSSQANTKPVVATSTSSFKPIEVRFLQNRTKKIETSPKVPVVQKKPPKPMMPQMKTTGLMPDSVALPRGVPRSFLRNQSSFGAIVPQNYSPTTPNQPQVWPHTAQYNATPYQATTTYVQNASQPFVPNTAPTFAPQSTGQVFAPQTFVPSAEPTFVPYAPQAVLPPTPANVMVTNAPMYVETNSDPVSHQPQAYSPSEAYADGSNANTEPHEGSESPDLLQSAQKRLSAFQRLGPPPQSKKPKLTINLLINSEQAVREVVDEQKNCKKDDKYTPAYLRDDVLTSTDETVMKYLVFWPWKKSYTPWKRATARSSQTLMAAELDQMEEIYEKENMFIQVSVTGYPESWTKEDVLDAILEAVKGKSFIPCFIDFTREQCKFVVIKCRPALLCLHRIGFEVTRDGERLTITVSQIALGLKQLEFIPRLVLRKRLASLHRELDEGADGGALDLKEFTLKSDVSHFIYFPLSRTTNQAELVGMQSSVVWAHLTHLDLSHNKLTSIDGFNLPASTPRLRSLDVSHNRLARAACLLASRALPLRALRLEGNPLCRDYIHPERYVAVLRMMFSTLREIDGVRVRLLGEPPAPRRHYCPAPARALADRLLLVHYPLLEVDRGDRALVRPMYHEDAVLTITYRDTLRTSPGYRYYRHLLGDCEGAVRGAERIAALLAKWPALEHDPYSFTVDVLHHTDTMTIIRVGGILKLTAETLAEDEHLLAFARTLVLGTDDGGVHYTIRNELLHWDAPTRHCVDVAFQINRVVTKRINLKLESPPDEYMKENLVNIFMKLTDLDKKSSTRCLEVKEWNFKSALEYFIKLLKLDSLEYLQEGEQN